MIELEVIFCLVSVMTMMFNRMCLYSDLDAVMIPEKR